MRATWLTQRGALLSVLAAGTIACELIVGIGDQPHLSDASFPDAEAGPAVCTLPTTGDAQVRLANVVPSLSKYDFCLTPTGGQTPTNGILASSGSGCPTGLLYRNVLAPFSVTSGSYRVDAIAPGSGCGSTPLATAPSVSFNPQTTTTVVLFGTDNGAQLQLKSFTEEKGSIAEPKVRFINAWSDGPADLEIGATNSDETPATILGVELFAQGAGFANIAAQSAKVDPLGYFTTLAGGSIPFGFAQTNTGTTTGVSVVRMVKLLGSLSTFAIGTTADPRFPVDLMICNQDQTDGIFTRCSNQTPNDIIVSVFNAQLQGRFTPTEGDRRTAIVNGVAGLDADFACITEVWDPKDKQAIVDGAKTHFPYSMNVATDFATQPNDPRDQQGNVPPAYTTPPCDSTSGGWSQAFTDCLATHCTTGAANDPNGTLIENATPCVVNNCLQEGVQLIADAACYSCTVTQVESGETFANTHNACTTNNNARYAFGGNNGIILLSTRPFLNGTPSDAGASDGGLPSDDSPALYTFPSTEYRAGVIRAPVDISAGSGLSTKLDVYCAILTTPATSNERPYTGQYGGGGGTSPEQWLNENILQGKQLDAYVKAVSGARKRRAIIAGDFYAGPAIGNLQGLNPTAYDTLTQVLPLAMAPDYTPACTFCGDNPLVAGAGESTAAIWSSYSLLSDLAVPEVLSNTVIMKELTASTDPSAFGLEAGTLPIPASFYYGMRTVVRVRP